MVDLPLDKLLEIGWADLRKNQAHFKEVARELEPNKEPSAVLEELGQMHPAPDQLLNSFRATFDGLIRFIRANHIVTIPSDVRPIVEETPPFMRATTFASMGYAGAIRESRRRSILQCNSARSFDESRKRWKDLCILLTSAR